MSTTKNLNVTSGLDTKDNTVYRDYTNTIDIWSTVKAICLGLGVITVIWIVIYFLARINCALNHSYDCVSGVYVFWSYPVLLLIAALITVVAAIPFIMQAIENSKYLHMRGSRIHRDDLRKNANDIFDVLKTSAKSEASAGLDQYSPSISNSSNSKSETTLIPDDDVDLDVIAWDKIFG